jgi:beta-barrel assembly-enhancing protease
MPRATRSVVALLFLLLLSGAVSGGCTISEEQELAMGRKLHGQFETESGGLYPDVQLQQYVESVGQSLARHAGRPNLEWRFSIVNSKEINAFAVPGGYIYLTQGLLFQMSNEAQLAGVLGHEAGHIADRHSAKQIGRARTTQGLSMVTGVVGSIFGYGWAGDVTSAVGALSMMSYSRDQERDADQLGLRYMTEAGYNPLGLVQLMQILQSAAGGKGAPEFLSTHPNPGNRLEYLTEAIQEKYVTAAQNGRTGEAEFQQNVLRRRGVAQLMTIDSVQPAATWCGVCRHEQIAAAPPAER